MKFKKGSTTFLKIIIFLIGIGMLALCICWLPMVAIKEPKTHPGDYSLYPLLVCFYGCCIAFSVALYEVFKLLTYVERNSVLTDLSLKSLKLIKKCGFIIIFFIVLGIVTLKIISKISGDDPAGPTALSIIGAFIISINIAIVDVLQKLLKNFLDTKSE